VREVREVREVRGTLFKQAGAGYISSRLVLPNCKPTTQLHPQSPRELPNHTWRCRLSGRRPPRRLLPQLRWRRTAVPRQHARHCRRQSLLRAAPVGRICHPHRRCGCCCCCCCCCCCWCGRSSSSRVTSVRPTAKADGRVVSHQPLQQFKDGEQEGGGRLGGAVGRGGGGGWCWLGCGGGWGGRRGGFNSSSLLEGRGCCGCCCCCRGGLRCWSCPLLLLLHGGRGGGGQHVHHLPHKLRRLFVLWCVGVGRVEFWLCGSVMAASYATDSRQQLANPLHPSSLRSGCNII